MVMECRVNIVSCFSLVFLLCIKPVAAISAVNPKIIKAYKNSPISYTNSILNAVALSSNELTSEDITKSKIDFTDYYNYFNTNSTTKALLIWKKTEASFITKTLLEHNVSEKLSVLPLILSGGNSTYKCANGGIGIWGMNYPVAKKNGLLLTKNIDERSLDSIATIAAAKHLKGLFDIYDDLNLVVLAYVSSPSLVNKAIKRAQSNSIDSILLHLDQPYTDWLKAFHGLSFIAENSDLKKVKAPFENKAKHNQLVLKKTIIYQAVEDKIPFDFDLFKSLNPQNRNKDLPENYPLTLDTFNYRLLTTNLDSIYFYQDSVLLNPFFKDAFELTQMLIYEVQSGDYLGKIAALYAVTVAELQSWNKLSGSRINIGQELVIYASDSTISDYYLYKVKQGDSIEKIAKKFPGVSKEKIHALNPNKSIKPGQLLKIKKK